MERDRPARSASIRSGETSRITTVVAELGEAGPADEPCVPAPKNAIRAIGGRLLRPSAASSPLAIAIIVSFEMLSRSELTTQ